MLKAQVTDRRPFGQAACELGLLTERQVHQLIGAQEYERPRWEQQLVDTGLLTQAKLEEHLDQWHAFQADTADIRVTGVSVN